MTATDIRQDSACDFIDRIEALGNSELAQLRRACGDRLTERTDALWFVGLVRNAASEEVAFLVATLLAQYSTLAIRRGGHRGAGNLGDMWREAIGAAPSDTLRRRMHILLDSDLTPDGGGDLPYRLRQMVRYAAAKGVGLDWARLLRDLKGWSHPNRYVQKQWARSFFAHTEPTDS